MSRARDLSRFANQQAISVDSSLNVGINSTSPDAKLDVAGIVSATEFYGDGSNLTGVSSPGLGTALSDDTTSPLNSIYFTNANLSVASTITVNPPSSASAAFTQYANIVLQNDADLIVADGDTFIPDILGIGTDVDEPGTLTGGAGKLRVDNITNKAGTGSPNFPHGMVIAGVVTATDGSFSGNVSVGGTLTYEDVTNVDSVGIITARSGIHVTGGSVGISTNSITANTNADDLQIGSRTDGGERGITIASSLAGSLRFADDGNDTAGYMYYSHSDNSLRFGANGAERLRLTSGGQLQATGAADVRLTLGSGGTAGTNDSVHVRADSANLLFMNANTGITKFESNGTETLRVENNGNVSINWGNPLAWPKVTIRDAGSTISSGNAINGSSMKGIHLANSSNDDTSIGLWAATGDAHWSGISFQRNNSSSTWGTDIRFYTHEDATNDLTYARERLSIKSNGYITTPYQPHFTAFGTTTWTDLTDGSKVNFADTTSNANLNNSNRLGGYNSSNSRFTAPVNGLYRFTVHMYFNTDNSSNVCSIVPRVNGSQLVPQDVLFLFSVSGNSTADFSANGSVSLYLSSGDYVEIYKRTGNTGTNRYYGKHSWFQGQLIG